MKLVRDWRHTWKYFSTQAMALGAAVQVTWVNLPDDMKAHIPSDWVAYATTLLLSIGVMGRMISQRDAEHG